MNIRRVLLVLLIVTPPSVSGASGPSGQPLLTLNCPDRCELVCEENGARTSYPASGQIALFALSGGTQMVRLNGGRWLRLGNESNCLFDGFE